MEDTKQDMRANELENLSKHSVLNYKKVDGVRVRELGKLEEGAEEAGVCVCVCVCMLCAMN